MTTEETERFARSTTRRILRLPEDAPDSDVLLSLIHVWTDGPGALEEGFRPAFDAATHAGIVRAAERSRWKRLWGWNPDFVRAAFNRRLHQYLEIGRT